MAEEQQALLEHFEMLVTELIAPTDGDVFAAESLHVGVITTDMGTGGYTIQTCDNPLEGDNGVLQNIGHPPGCAERYSSSDCDRDECPWLSYSTTIPDDGHEPSAPPIWEDFACIAALGTCGCGFEQHLESSLVALTTQTAPGQPNEGFVREDSLLAVIYVSDEDDCSTNDEDMFDPHHDDLGSLNVRCLVNPDRLFPISRYHDAFVELHGDRVVVAGIVGVPPNGSWDAESLRSIGGVNPENPIEQLKSCDTAMGVGYPPVRIAELTESFGDRGVLTSICRQDWSDAIEAIASAIQRHLGRSCIDLPAGADVADCRMVEVLENDDACAEAQENLGLDDDGRRHCLAPAEQWSIDDSAEACPGGQLMMMDGSAPSQRARLECMTAR